MVKEGNVRSKRKIRTRVRLGSSESDQWDEDYKVNTEEFDESKESSGKFEEDWVRNKVNKAGRPTGPKGVLERERNGSLKLKRNRERVSAEEEDIKVSRVGEEDDNISNEMPRKKGKFSYREEKEVDDYNGSEFEEDDDEFTLDEKEVGRLSNQKKETAEAREGKKNANVLKRTKKRNQGSKRQTRTPRREEFRDDYSTLHKKKKKLTGSGRRKSDFVGSGPSVYRYTMSEEEREQVREAGEFCGSLTTAPRSSCSSKMNEKEIQPPQRESPGRKGKEKLEDMKIEAVKQVCGICLTEEGKRTVKGTLNCCSHYFCFGCIMEWSKVESRCPHCKQRFSSISKAARTDGGCDSRSVVISVPARDQVYQPSEEELRGLLDPYENVLCTECQLGGDDAHMLLCDLCDSAAHTYCVGLGLEVPEGNWYCEDCRPTAMPSSSEKVLNPSPSHGASHYLSAGSSLAASVRGTFDLNELYITDTPFNQGTRFSPSHRYHDFQAAAAPASGSRAYTVFERRRIRHQINQLLNNGGRQPDRTTGVARISGNNLFGWQVSRGRELAPEHTVAPERIVPQNIYLQGRIRDNAPASFYSWDSISPRFSSLRMQMLPNQASTFTDHSFGRLAQNEYAEINTRLGLGLFHQLPHPYSSRPNIINDVPLEKEQVQSMVRSHIKSLSRNLELGHSTFKDIARSSTHTILAACGLEHRPKKVYPVRKPPLNCNHFECATSVQKSLMKGQCSSCFNLFVRNVVKEVMRTRIPFSSRD